MNGDIRHGAVAIDPKALRRCLGSFATGVAVVTTRHEDKDLGITVNSFTSLSLDPPLVLWCLARSSRTYTAFTASDHFAINVLAVDQVTVSNRFAFRAEEEFPTDVPFHRAIAGIPLLDGICSHFQCRRTDVFDGGDHVVMVGEVIDFAGSDRPGLVYRGGQYAVADAHPSAVSQSQDNLNKGFLDSTVRPALEGITRRFESFFDEELREAGISSKESQVLGLLLSRGALDTEEIANLTLVSGSFLEETLDSLKEKDLIARDGGGCALTTSGRTLASSWFDRLRSYRAQALGPIAPAEAEALQRTLDRLSEWIKAASAGSPLS
jgi:flavin reductase (DIM6/NTAB) family NADH-FMN oxidoreductase RutF/DNA-binding MarR family transcriptional regulator